MLRPGICDLRICDLEMDCPAGPSSPARWAAVRPVRPRPRRSRPPERRGNPDTHPRPPPGVRSAAGSASQRRFPSRGPLTCGVTIWRAMICRIYPAMRRVSRRDPAHLWPGCRAFPPRKALAFRPVGNARFPGHAVAFPGHAVAFPPGYPGVSAGRRARAATRSRRGRPHGPGARARRRPHR
jgi:hypothetical protein